MRAVGQFRIEVGGQVVRAGQLHGDERIIVVGRRDRVTGLDHAQAIGVDLGLQLVDAGGVIGARQHRCGIVLNLIANHFDRIRERIGDRGELPRLGGIRFSCFAGVGRFVQCVRAGGVSRLDGQFVVHQVQIVLGQRRPARFGQRIGQGDQTGRQGGLHGHPRGLVVQGRHGGGDGGAGLGERVHACRSRQRIGRKRTLEVTFRRAGDGRDLRHIGHGESTVHRVHGAQQAVGHRLRSIGSRIQPRLQRRLVHLDLGFQDLAQHAVDVGRRTLDHRHSLGRNGLHDRRHRGARRPLQRHVEGLFARGHAIGDGLHGLQIGGDTTAIAQCRVELRQRVVGLADQRNHGRRGRAAAIEHAVEHALDLPAELAQGARTHQPATALEGMEHATDRAQAVQVVRRGAPGRKQVAQVHQLFVELFDEHLADVLVDVLAIVFEARLDADVIGGRGHRRAPRCGGRRHGLGVGAFRAELRRGGIQLGQEAGSGIVQLDTADHRIAHRGVRLRCIGCGLGGRVDIVGERVERRRGAVLRRCDGNLLQERRQRLHIHLARRDAGRSRGPCINAVAVAVDISTCIGIGIDASVSVSVSIDVSVIDLQREHVIGVAQAVIEGEFDRLVAQRQQLVLGGHRIEPGAGGHEGRHLQRGVGDVVAHAIGLQRGRQRGHPPRSAGRQVGNDRVEMGKRQPFIGVVLLAQRPLRRIGSDRRGGGIEHQRHRRRCHGRGGRRRRIEGEVRQRRRQVGRARYLGGHRELDRLGGRRVPRCQFDGFGRNRQRFRAGVGGWLVRIRQRPVTQRFQAAAGDVQDVVAARPAFAQGFQVVLQAGHGIGQGIQLAPTGHALLAEQFHRDVLAHALQVVGRGRQIEHAQRAGHLAEQARHFLQLLVIPVGFDEGDEMLARGGKIGNGFMGQHFHRAAVLHRAGIVLATAAGAQMGDLVVQRGIHVQQRAGDIQQQRFIDLLHALDHLAQRIALLHDHATGHAQAHHAQRIGDRAQLVDLGLQLHRLAAGTQVQVQRVLDPQQLFLDRVADRIEQLAVAAAQAATRVVQLGLGGARAVRCEGEQHAFIDARCRASGADVVEQRQQHDRDVAVAVLQALQVIGQQHAATHQRGAGFIAVGYVAGADRVGQLFQLLGHHRRGVQLDHAQGALHLVQVAGAEAHPAAVGRVFHVVLDLVAHLAQGLVQLRLDPAQRSMAHGIAQRAHARSPGSSAHMACGDFSRCIICLFLPSPPCPWLTPAA